MQGMLHSGGAVDNRGGLCKGVCVRNVCTFCLILLESKTSLIQIKNKAY